MSTRTVLWSSGLCHRTVLWSSGLCQRVVSVCKREFKKEREREGWLGELVAGTIKTSQLLGLWLITASVDIY